MTIDVATRVYTVPLTDPETDGTLAWTATTVVIAEATAAGRSGLGWTYGPAAAAGVIDDVLTPVITGLDPFDIGHAYARMRQAVRNVTGPGLASLAISAVDVALWDLKATLLGVPLSRLSGRALPHVPLYGSGGFTSMTDDQLRTQLDGWLGDDGMTAVKIKIGEDRGGNITRDLHRIRLTRAAAGDEVTLMVDANGGYQTKQAVHVAGCDAGIAWFEEPVSSDHLADLALLRGMITPEVTAGEYGTTLDYFERMCATEAVDCLQVDATRCGGYTGLLAAAAVADAHGLQISTHCAPNLHAPVAIAVANLRHAEYFADHVRADRLLFDGVPAPDRGRVIPQDQHPGHGMTLREEAEKFRTG